jgi:hypothetical protein
VELDEREDAGRDPEEKEREHDHGVAYRRGAA